MESDGALHLGIFIEGIAGMMNIRIT